MEKCWPYKRSKNEVIHYFDNLVQLSINNQPKVTHIAWSLNKFVLKVSRFVSPNIDHYQISKSTVFIVVLFFHICVLLIRVIWKRDLIFTFREKEYIGYNDDDQCGPVSQSIISECRLKIRPRSRSATRRLHHSGRDLANTYTHTFVYDYDLYRKGVMTRYSWIIVAVS